MKGELAEQEGAVGEGGPEAGSAGTLVRRRPKDRRAKILDAAASEFARSGFDGVTVADLASSVGITAPALYRYFTNKDEILTTVAGTMLEELVGIVDGTPMGPRHAEEMVRALTTAVLDRPAHVVTYLRERHRWVEPGPGLTVDERRFFDRLADHLQAAVPELDNRDVRLRVTASLGVLRGIAERTPPLGRPDAEEFMTAGLLAMAQAPPIDARGGGEAEGEECVTGWWPEPSPRERILRAALPLFRRSGVAGVGIGAIGEAAGVGATNVHRYYESKDEVLIDIYDRVGARVEVGVDAALDAAVDADDALERLLVSYARVAFSAADLIVVVTENRGALPRSEVPRLRRRDRRVTDVWRAVVGSVRPELRRDEVTMLVRSVLALINGFPRGAPDALPPVEAVTPLASAFVRG